MEKACPVVIRERHQRRELLAFQHPLAGKQFVKGTIEPGETLIAACERELQEESGINARAVDYLGTCLIQCQGLTYGFYRMETDDHIADRFDFFCEDDGGHVFSFFWQPLNKPLTDEWHAIFHEIVDFLKPRL